MLDSITSGGTASGGQSTTYSTQPDEERKGEDGEVKGGRLTKRQTEVLEVIRAHVKRRGVPPSRTELARELDMASPSAVDGHLSALARKGWVELFPSVERGIKLIREGAPLLEVEELAEIAAGRPMVPEEPRESRRLGDYDSVTELFRAKPDFFLTVRGTSMDGVGFATGDIVAVRKQPAADNGDIVVARIGDEITLKRFMRKADNTVELQPESNDPEHTPIRIGPESEDSEIVGIVVGAIIGTRRSEGTARA